MFEYKNLTKLSIITLYLRLPLSGHRLYVIQLNTTYTIGIIAVISEGGSRQGSCTTETITFFGWIFMRFKSCFRQFKMVNTRIVKGVGRKISIHVLIFTRKLHLITEFLTYA